MRLMRLPRSLLRRRLVDAALLLLLALGVVAVTTLYISRERNLHWWVDWYNRTTLLVDALQTSPIVALTQLQASLAWERNSLFTLPLIPFLLIFGKSRLVYEIGLALVYLLPFSLVLGAIATCLIPVHSRAVFWSTALLTVMVPVNWIPTFLGIPDTGGALFIALATWVYVQDVDLKQRWRVPTIGVLLAVAILLRRHFTYGAIAFLATLLLQVLIQFCSALPTDVVKARQVLIHWSWRIGLIALTTLAVLLAVAWQFTYSALTRDYGNLYASWSLPISDMVERYLWFYGWVTWTIVVAGFSAGVVRRVLSLPVAQFIILSGMFSLAEWLFQLRYGNVFYALHVTPLVVLGIAAFLWTSYLAIAPRSRLWVVGAVSSYLALNLMTGLMPLGNWTQTLRPWFALNMPPLVRADYDEVIRLINTLRQLTPQRSPATPIYVVGAQRLQLNSSLIRTSEQWLYGRENSLLTILGVPQVDSQDFYPLEPLLQARYVVMPSKLPSYPGHVTQVPAVGEWLPPQEHDVVQVVLDAFNQGWEIGKDFGRLPMQFSLEPGITVSIYERLRPTSIDTAIRTFHRMQQQIGTRPGGQTDWLSLSTRYNQTTISQNDDLTHRLVVFPESPLFLSTNPFLDHQTKGIEPVASFLHIGARSRRSQISGWLDLWTQPCNGASLQLSTLNAEGDVTETLQLVDASQKLKNFNVLFRSDPIDYLVLNVLEESSHNKFTKDCTVDINRVSISR